MIDNFELIYFSYFLIFFQNSNHVANFLNFSPNICNQDEYSRSQQINKNKMETQLWDTMQKIKICSLRRYFQKKSKNLQFIRQALKNVSFSITILCNIITEKDLCNNLVLTVLWWGYSEFLAQDPRLKDHSRSVPSQISRYSWLISCLLDLGLIVLQGLVWWYGQLIYITLTWLGGEDQGLGMDLTGSLVLINYLVVQSYHIETLQCSVV